MSSPLSRSPSPGSPTTPTLSKKRKRLGGWSSSKEGQGFRSSPTSHGREELSEDEPIESDSEGSDLGEKGVKVPRRSHMTQGQSGWIYELEIIQHPQRARACGPLSPPPIIRLWVRAANGDLVDPALIDTRFLVLMVDLWSADCRQERNIVMHPISAGVTRMDSPPSGMADLPGSSSRPSTGTSRPVSGSSAGISSFSGGSWRPQPSSPNPSTSRLAELPTTSAGRKAEQSATVSPAHPSWPHSQPIHPPQFHRMHSFSGRQPVHDPEPPRPSTAPSSQPLSPPRGSSSHRSSYTLPPLASIAEENPASSSRLTLPALQRQQQQRPSSSSSLWNRPRTSYSTDLSTAPTEYSFGRPISSSGSSWYASTDQGAKDRPSSGWSDARPWSSGIFSHRPASSGEIGISPRSSHFGRMPEQYGMPYTSPLMRSEIYPTSSWEAERSRYASGQAAAQYSRVLVGKVTAVCHKLQDEDGRPGLFFFAADLGIRTEGTFTLRMAMTDLVSLMKPDVWVGDKAPVLAETFSDPFTVYSAKRFPGVIPTTPLTKVFAAQGVKLSVRENRKGGGGDDGDDDDD
ncbi:hypothetical protein IAR55_002290 [Kwoniella newhampshirensis]|uniref:Velvet domain-containing protein n=1 Tax=Kwoniella newhampshirensis TaxID=1651941 RepID=A0AAW0YQG9_9TREE